MRRSWMPASLLALACSALLAGPAGAANPVPPKATTGTATAITVSGATVGGTVDPEETATTYVF